MAVATVDTDALARVGTALADSTRREILLALLEGPRYPSDIASELSLTKANVSNHLACLRGCGLVRATPEGRRVRYDLPTRGFASALAKLASLALPVEDPTCTPAGQPVR